MKVQPDGHVTHLHVHDLETEGVSVLLSAKPLSALRAVINFETGQAAFRNLEPETVCSWNQVRRDTCGWIGSNNASVSDNTTSVLRELQLETNSDWMSRNSKTQMLVARAASRRARLTLLTLRQCGDRAFSRQCDVQK